MLYSVSEVKVRAAQTDVITPLQGGIRIEKETKPGRVAINGHTVSLPCTLRAVSSHNFFEYNDKSYRGSVILIRSGNSAAFGICNYLLVESYLRGVVPREIGHPGQNALEAIKAQAVAARTYAYRRILDRRTARFDVHPGVADQVYGGVDAESAISSKAVAATAGLVLAYNGSLAHTYYHSTCGGHTDNIEAVWNKPPQPYLTASTDTNEKGECFCRGSRYFEWTQQWSTARLSQIAARFSKKYYPSRGLRGTIRSMKITARTPGGRVKSMTVTTTRGTYTFGGDKIRFILRRDEKGYPILRSARITSADVTSRKVVITGTGYGHGVGMCQVGAIARARAGQRFAEILGAYYPHTRIRRVLSHR
jgi:stage II sporulation protein D